MTEEYFQRVRVAIIPNAAEPLFVLQQIVFLHYFALMNLKMHLVLISFAKNEMLTVLMVH